MNYTPLVHSVFFEKWEALGFKVHLEPESVTLVSSLPHWNCNKVLLLHTEVPSCLIEQKKKYFLELQLPFSLIVPQGASFCTREDMQLKMELACMELNLSCWNACPTNSEVVVRMVKSPREFHEHCLVIDQNFPMSEKAHHLLKKDHLMLLYTGYLHDEPVASGRLFLGKTYASIYCIGTVGHARKKGAAFSILQAVLAEAKKHGYTKASLSATESARTLYETVGFEYRGLYRIFVKEWPELESNQRHKDFQSSALPSELSGHREGGLQRYSTSPI
jgi:hypothetical protein